MKRFQNFWLSLPLFFMLGGCLVGPNYIPPDPCIPDSWVGYNRCDEMTRIQAWWQIFQDPMLDWCIETAAHNNLDIFVAEANIFQALAIRKITASQLFPSVNIDLSASRTYFSKNGPLFAIDTPGIGNTAGLPFEIQVPQIQNIYTALVDTSWQIDLFGKIRRQVQVAEADLGSSIENRNGVLISVIAEVALNYFNLRSGQQKGVLIEKNISLLERKRDVAKWQNEKGLVNQLALENIEAELADEMAKLPSVYTEIYQAIYALSVLMGKLPEALLEELSPIQALPQPPLEIACGLRSDLLRTRPDVRQAERNLASATAQIGVAIASFFPSFSLSGNLGLQSLQLRQLFQARSLTWSVGGGSTIPIFQGGNLVGNLHLSEGGAIAAAFTYQQTILTALKEAEAALVAYNQELKTAEALLLSVKKNLSLDSLTNDRYSKGLVGVTDMLDSGRQLNIAEQNLLQSETSILTHLVQLYKALGGGWESF